VEDIDRKALIATAYLGPTSYFSWLKGGEVYFEAHEHYQKQSYRNRCYILGANGVQALVIPVVKLHPKTFVKDIRIDYSCRWKSVHLRAIESAYRNSPFYLYYIDYIEPFYRERHNFLWDFNLEFTRVILDLLGLKVKIMETSSYALHGDPRFIDARDIIHPKRELLEVAPGIVFPTYRQVFQEKHGFVPNLSILDALFNAGPRALEMIPEWKV
jgi:hypothetical protein